MSGQAYTYCGSWMNDGCLNLQKHKGVITLEGVNLTGKIYRRTFQKSCYRPECPVCFKKWLYREANSATFKIETLGKKIKRKPVHVIISPGSKHWNMSIEDMRKKAYKIIKSTISDHSEFAGCLLFHPARLNKNTKEWYWSPHFHCLTFGWFDSGKVRRMYKNEEWIIKNLGIRKSVFATMLYQLSHAGIKKGKHSVTWFGGLSYSSISKYNQECKPKDETKHLCPICDVELVPIKWILQEKGPPEGEFEGFDDSEGWINYQKVSCL